MFILKRDLLKPQLATNLSPPEDIPGLPSISQVPEVPAHRSWYSAFVLSDDLPPIYTRLNLIISDFNLTVYIDAPDAQVPYTYISPNGAVV